MPTLEKLTCAFVNTDEPPTKSRFLSFWVEEKISVDGRALLVWSIHENHYQHLEVPDIPVIEQKLVGELKSSDPEYPAAYLQLQSQRNFRILWTARIKNKTPQ